jgi:hypothetical protein
LSVRWAGLAATAALAVAAAGAAAGGGGGPLLGANYFHYEDVPPACSGVGIVHDYDHPGVRGIARQQLAAMRAAGMRALRLVFYHSSEGDQWNLMRSSGGRLAEPYRTNLVRYVRDVRAAGFASLTIAFNPWDSNDPIGYTKTPYDPSKSDENWQLIRDVRTLIKEAGPPTTRFDLIAEGAPDTWQPRLREYSAEMWKRYVDAFGADDATISIIVKSGEGGTFGRLPELVEALRATGRPLPTWFDVHPSWSASAALADLRWVDGYLSAQNLTQPLVIGETVYDNAAVAEAIATFTSTSSRPVLEVLEWPLSRPGTTWATCPTPPYRVAAYARALTHIRPYTLNAKVSGRTVQLTSDGVPVTVLGAGAYRVVVRDSSSRVGSRFVGARFDRRTTARFRGMVMWRMRLHPYETARYGRLRGALKRVEILGNGGG